MKKIPQGFTTLTPCVAVKEGKAAIALYEKALGAVTQYCMMIPDTNKVSHACIKIGNSLFFLFDENKEMGSFAPGPQGSSVGFYLYVDDPDAAHKKAVAAGMKELLAPQDMFWGDRMSAVQDPYGYKWNFAAQVREVSPEEIEASVRKKWKAE